MNGSKPNPNTIKLAQWLLVREAGADKARADTSAVICVSEKLRRPLSTLAGAVGFGALQARALAISKKQVPSLKVVTVTEDGSLEGLAALESDDAVEAGRVLIAQLLTLLDIFIGETLMLRLVRDVWPDLPAENVEVRENQR